MMRDQHTFAVRKAHPTGRDRFGILWPNVDRRESVRRSIDDLDWTTAARAIGLSPQQLRMLVAGPLEFVNHSDWVRASAAILRAQKEASR